MKTNPDLLYSTIANCMLRDRPGFYRRVKQLQKSAKSNTYDSRLKCLEVDIQRSLKLCSERTATLPVPEFPANLPVCERRDDISNAIKNNQVIIVAGETGSGKTTQLPKICMMLGRGAAGMIGHTQPRRLAARSIASRISSELCTEAGQAVGYKVRFKDQVGPATHLKLMTDGILLAEIQGDRFLNEYDTLIIDEAHERSLNIDFILGYLKQLLPKRKDLKLIITSATIDTERFSSHFNNAPVIEVSGRTYPVEVRYRPLIDDKDGSARDSRQAILDAVDELSFNGVSHKSTSNKSPSGNILIFFSGEREIREAAEALRKHQPPNTEILPLYARLNAAEQNRAFSQGKHRRIILATNVAETSLTVPGIHYVIDTGTVRISRYNYRSKIQRLPIEPVSQSSANQRKGRCGRISEGICIRLYSEQDFLNRPEYTDPEIKRTNLASVILKMESFRMGDIDSFPFIDPPDSRYIKDGYKLLYELLAVDKNNKITATGREISRFPVDPKIGRMLNEAAKLNCLKEILIIGSALGVQDPRERPADKQQQADEKHKIILQMDEDDKLSISHSNSINSNNTDNKKQEYKSDYLFYLKLWGLFSDRRKHLSKNQLVKFCKKHFLSYTRLQEWRDIYLQIFTLLKQQGVSINEHNASDADVHQALLSGLLGNTGNKSLDSNEYTGPRNIRFYIHPGSWQAKKPPKWVMCAELVETTKLYGRMAAQIKPEWIENLAGHLIKRTYSEPHWEKGPAQVAAFERTTLYGITLCQKRRINYGPVDPVISREIFIREALVEGNFNTRASFFDYNRSVISDIEKLESKGRRRDILVDELTLYSFYDERLPSDVYNGKAFEKWHKSIQKHTPELLYLQKPQLMNHTADHINEDQYPGNLEINGINIVLDYHFEPGHAEDGVTAIVPVAILHQLGSCEFDYLVPGMLRDKVIALIKSLPKSVRKYFVPTPEYADKFFAANFDRSVSLVAALSGFLNKIGNREIGSDTWQDENLPDFYRMNYRVIDQSGNVLGSGRDLILLQNELSHQSASAFTALPASDVEREGVIQWDFGDLPEVIELEQQGYSIKAWPAIVDDSLDSVSIRLFSDKVKAQDQMRYGLRRLFRIVARKDMKYLQKNLLHFDKIQMHYTSIGNKNTLLQDLEDAIIDYALFTETEVIRTENEFKQLATAAQKNLITISNETCEMVKDILAQHHKLVKRLQGNFPLTHFDAISDIKQQLSCLVYPGFISTTKRESLKNIPRYLKAINLRLDKLERSLDTDKMRHRELGNHWELLYSQLDARPQRIMSPEWETYRWMVEEMRVSLFAQELKTAVSVSIKKLDLQKKLL